MKFLALISLVFLLLTAPAKAHPHAWIDMETSLVFDDQGQVTGLRIGWLFDDFYSAFSMEGVEPTQEALRELAEINLGNLSEYDYFTKIEVNGERATHQKVTQFNTQMIGNRLWMDFLVPLEQPVNPKTSTVIYSVYDPTFYVEILHALEGDPIRLEGTGSLGCGFEMIKPEPAEELAFFAASLDQQESPDMNLGQYFAEKVALSCL